MTMRWQVWRHRAPLSSLLATVLGGLVCCACQSEGDEGMEQPVALQTDATVPTAEDTGPTAAPTPTEVGPGMPTPSPTLPSTGPVASGGSSGSVPTTTGTAPSVDSSSPAPGSAGGTSGAGGATATTGGASPVPAGGRPVASAGAPAEPDAGTTPTAFDGKELFILFGQSNMSGMSPMPEEPWPVDENITFMVQYDCPRLDQTKDEWLPAEPPLHGCQWATSGIGLGLADYFGVALAEAWPDAEIGLIPNAIPAVTIDVFMKGGPSPGGGMKALPDGYTSAYTLMVDRVKAAQAVGRVRGILLHQGESDYNQGFGEEWLGKLATVVADLRADLGLGEEVPFLAGQIPPGNYDGHNVYVDQVPDAIPNSAVISSEGTRIHDVAHFDAESARIMGQRYAEKLLELVAAP